MRYPMRVIDVFAIAPILTRTSQALLTGGDGLKTLKKDLWDGGKEIWRLNPKYLRIRLIYRQAVPWSVNRASYLDPKSCVYDVRSIIYGHLYDQSVVRDT